MDKELIVPDATQFEKKALDVLAQANAIEIHSDEHFQLAGTFLRGLKGYIKELDTMFDDSIKAAHEAHKKIVGTKKKLTEPISKAEEVIKLKMATRQLEVERLALQERKRLEAEARAQEEERRLSRAAELEKQGKSNEAMAVIAAPVLPVKVDAPAPAKVEGVSFKTVHKARLTDMTALVEAVAQGKAPSNLLMVNDAALRQYALATQGNVKVPGIEFYTEQQVAARA